MCSKNFYLFIIIVFVLIFSGGSLQSKEFFRGGMFFHAGYLSNDLGSNAVDGICTGLGGKIVFATNGNIRWGSEGYVSNYHYRSNDGFYKLGWGGLLVEYQFGNQDKAIVVGLSSGPGRVRDLTLLDGDYSDNSSDEVIYRTLPTWVFSPHVSFEKALTENINLVVKADYLFYPFTNYAKYIAHGPRLYVGILFSR